MGRSHKATSYVVAVVTVLGLVFGGAVLAQGNAVVKLVPTAPTADIGKTAVIAVNVENVNNLFGAEFHMTFDPKIVEVVDADPGTDGIQIGLGDFLAPDFVAQNVANNTAGTADFAISQMAPHGAVTGSGTLAILTLRGKVNGISDVDFTQVLLSDATGTQIVTSAQNGSITIGAVAQPTHTPTPTATPAPAKATNTPTATPTPTPTTAAGTPTGTPTAAPTAAPPPAPASGTLGAHVVQTGETLYSIGRAYGVQPTAIAARNGIVNPGQIYRGTELVIPVAPWSPIPPGPTAARQFEPGTGVPAPTPVPVPGCRYYHTVKYGETLTLIAWRYGVSVWNIARASNVANVNLIYAGDVLCVP